MQFNTKLQHATASYPNKQYKNANFLQIKTEDNKNTNFSTY